MLKGEGGTKSFEVVLTSELEAIVMRELGGRGRGAKNSPPFTGVGGGG